MAMIDQKIAEALDTLVAFTRRVEAVFQKLDKVLTLVLEQAERDDKRRKEYEAEAAARGERT